MVVNENWTGHPAQLTQPDMLSRDGHRKALNQVLRLPLPSKSESPHSRAFSANRRIGL